ncbi:MAG: APC family permease [Candidatus Bathyarchaeia archaeon]
MGQEPQTQTGADKVFIRKSSGMVRGFSLRDMFVFNMCGLAPTAMMSAMFALSAAYYPAANVLWSLIIALPFVLCFAVSYAALSGAMPRSGGDYVFSSRVLGPVPGLIGGLIYNQPVRILADSSLPIYFFSYVLPMTLVLSFPGNPAVQGFVNTMSNPAMIIAFGTIVIWGACAVAIFGAKPLKFMFYLMATMGLLAAAIIIVELAISTPASFIQAFNAWGVQYHTSYSSIVQTAQTQGWDPSSIKNSLFVSLAPITFLFEFIFTAWPIYLASEVKSAEKAVPYSIISSILVAMGISITIAALYVLVVPKDFMAALSYLAYVAPSGHYPLPWNPEMITLLSVVFRNPITTLLVGFGVTLFELSFIFGDFIGVSRTYFYWAFDRIIPSKFASLNPRTKTPVFSLVFYGCVVECVMFVAVYSNILAWIANLMVLMIVGFTPAMISAAFLAYRRRDIFEKAPGWVQRKVAGVPIPTIAGGTASCFMIVLFILAAVVFPSFGGPTTPVMVAFMLFWIFITIPWYYFVRYYHLKKEGIDIAWAFQQVPPA